MTKYGLNISKPYSNQVQLYECLGGLCEAFRWTTPLMQYYKSDESAKFYKTKALTVNISMNKKDYTDLEQFKDAAPTLTWRPLNMNHDHKKFLPFPEARVDWAAYEDQAVECIIRIPNELKSIQAAIESGDIMHVSIEGEPRGASGNAPEYYNFTALALLEKDVTLPGDPLTYLEPLFMRESMARSLVESLEIDREKDIRKREVKEMTENLKEYVKAPIETPWDFDASKYDIDQLRYACAVVTGPTGTDGEYTKNDCHLPHHLPGDGKSHGGTLVWRGVAAAGAILRGSRGGVKIGSADKAKAKTHLATHYREFDRTPPWETEKLAETMTIDEIKAKILSLEKEYDELSPKSTPTAEVTKSDNTDWNKRELLRLEIDAWKDLYKNRVTAPAYNVEEGISGMDVCGQCKFFEDLKDKTVKIEHSTGGDSVQITRSEGAVGPGVGKCGITNGFIRKQDAACTDGRPRESPTGLDRTMEQVKELAEKAELLREVAFGKTLLKEAADREATEREGKIRSMQEGVSKDQTLIKQQREIAELTSISAKTKEELENQRKISDALKEQNARFKIGMENTDRDIKLYKDQNDRYERSVQKLNDEVVQVKEELTKSMIRANDETAKRAEAVQRAINADNERSRIQTESALLMQQLSEKTAEISEYAKRLSDSAGRELRLQREVQELKEKETKLVDEMREMKQKLSRTPKEIQISI